MAKENEIVLFETEDEKDIMTTMVMNLLSVG